MNISQKTAALNDIYTQFESAAEMYKKEALCKSGCAFCCSEMGDIDIITLEGVIIRDYIEKLPGKQKAAVKRKLKRNRSSREKLKKLPCPFLQKNSTCLIYPVRPFSCRQLYSVKPCDNSGPTIHRLASELAKETVKKLQELDNTGYSGHISFILHLLDRPNFRKQYLSGGFNPPDIMDYGKAHRLAINCFAAGK